MVFFSVYVIQIIFILICGYVFKNSKRRFLIAAFLALFVVMAFRNATKIGNDSATSYYVEFIIIQNTSYSWTNPGLTFVMKIIHRFIGDYQWVIIITAIWVCFAYYKLLVKYSENAFISVMWFIGMLFYSFLFDALKQTWAMAFLCFAFDAIFEKKPVRFHIFVGLAVLFHFPALIFLPAYWIAKLKLKKNFPIILAVAFLFVYIFRTQLLISLTSAYGGRGSIYPSEVQFFGTKVIYMLLMLAYGFYQFFLRKYDASTENSVFSVLMYFMGIAAVIQTFCFYNNIFERLADYYYQFSILFVPLLLSRNSYGSNLMNADNNSELSNILGSAGTLSKPHAIDISTVLFAIICVFCVCRYVIYMVNNSFFSPFYFFWQ